MPPARFEADSRTRLLDAATELFTGGSFNKVGIAEICDKADVNKGTFYHFFPSKLDLLIEVLSHYTTEIQKKLETLAASQATPARKLEGIFQISQAENESWKANHGSVPGSFLGNVILELAANEPDVRAKANSALLSWHGAIEPIVKDFFKTEKIHNLDAKDATDVLIGMAQGANVLAKARNDPRIFRAFAKLAIELLRAAANPR